MSVMEFKGDYRWLSNFWMAPQKVGDTTYASNEHFYQACKTENPIQKAMIIAAGSPRSAKFYGAKADLIPFWDQIKDAVMLQGLLAKFDQNSELRYKLIATGDQLLVEGNYWHDTYWGQCTCQNHLGSGENKLGRMLMAVRRFYQ